MAFPPKFVRALNLLQRRIGDETRSAGMVSTANDASLVREEAPRTSPTV